MSDTREPTSIRLSSSGLAWLEELKWTWRLDRSTLVREALAYARQNQDEFKEFVDLRARANEEQ